MATKNRKWPIILPLLIGIAIFLLLLQNRAEPDVVNAQERARAVRVVEAQQVTVTPRVVAHGNVTPGTVWEAVAKVSGEVIKVHPRLEVGYGLAEGEIALRIDPTDYQLSLAEAEATVEGTKANLAELEIREANIRSLVAIEEKALNLAERELERKRRLLKRGTIASSEFEKEQQNLLSRRESLVTQRNKLKLIPTERRSAEAELARYEAQLKRARRDLARTAVTLPITAHIVEVDVEEGEYVQAGERLFAADGVKVAEIAAQVPMNRMVVLMQSERTLSIDQLVNMSLEELGLKAKVTLNGADAGVSWPARVARIGATHDARTRTVSVIVEVDNPYEGIKPGVRPPLINGMFVDVGLTGQPRRDTVIVPRSALLGGHVLVVNDQHRLERRAVQVVLRQSGYVGIASGLEAGERIVVSDLAPIIEGMLLAPMRDEALEQRLRRLAEGSEALS